MARVYCKGLSSMHLYSDETNFNIRIACGHSIGVQDFVKLDPENSSSFSFSNIVGATRKLNGLAVAETGQ